MKARILIVIAVVALAVAFAYTASAPAAPSPTKAVPAAVPQPQPVPVPAAEPHPEIRDAIAALRNAKGHLEHAAHDFGGHRLEAIHATDEAIRQLELCLKYDR